MYQTEEHLGLYEIQAYKSSMPLSLLLHRGDREIAGSEIQP